MKTQPVALHEYRRLKAKNQLEKAIAQLAVVAYLESIGFSGGWSEDVAEQGQDLRFSSSRNCIMTKDQMEEANKLLAKVRDIDMQGFEQERNTVLLSSAR